MAKDGTSDGAAPGLDDDAALMAAVSRGDDSAFTQLVVRHQKPLVNFFCRLGSSLHDAEDLAQLTFVRLFRYRSTYTPSAKFTTFLYLLARQVRIDEVRKRIRDERTRQALAAEVLGEAANPPHVPKPGLMDDIQQALGGLDEAHREVVVLGLVRDLPYEEVAAILSIPVGTVKSRMHHALKRLRELLEK